MSLVLLLFIVLWDVAEAVYCYTYTYYSGYTTYYCYYSYVYLPIGSIVGAVIGSLIGLACLIGLIVFFCCIRPRRLASRGQILYPPGTNVAVVGASGLPMSGGYINTAAYPPGTQPAYPQYNYPPQAAAPDGSQSPPPYNKENS